MVNATLILGILGNITALLLFVSPIPTFRRIVRSKSTEDFSGIPFVATLFNCLLWVFYGNPLVIKDGTLVMTINGFGVGLELLFTILFLMYADRRSRVHVLRLLSAVVIIFAMIVAVTLLAIHDMAGRKLVVGAICVVVTTLMYCSPLSVMGLVIRTKSVEYMPLLFSVFIFANGSAWTGYAIFDKDIFIGIPNGLGALLGIAQLTLHAIYGRNGFTVDIEKGELPKPVPSGHDRIQPAKIVPSGDGGTQSPGIQPVPSGDSDTQSPGIQPVPSGDSDTQSPGIQPGGR